MNRNAKLFMFITTHISSFCTMMQQCYIALIAFRIHYSYFTEAAQTGIMADNVRIINKTNILMKNALRAHISWHC